MEEEIKMIDFVAPIEDKMQGIIKVEGVEHLVNPLDNAINEKCSRIKRVFNELMDEYTASYYIISGHVEKRIAGSNRIWYERLKNITLPRDLVVWESKMSDV